MGLKKLLPALTSMMQEDVDESVRVGALQGLVHMGDNSPKVIEAIKEARRLGLLHPEDVASALVELKAK